MHRIEQLPVVFEQYRNVGGVLDFAVFDDANGSHDEILQAASEVAQGSSGFSTDRLLALGYRQIYRRQFFGDWYDSETSLLRAMGSYRLQDGTEVENPNLAELEKAKIVGGSWTSADPGTGGDFAYAFLQPPYGLHGRPGERQAIFDGIRDFILPRKQRVEIRDWASPKLTEVSDYFEAGMEWWGVFLFSVYLPDLRRLTIIAGSATD